MGRDRIQFPELEKRTDYTKLPSEKTLWLLEPLQLSPGIIRVLGARQRLGDMSPVVTAPHLAMPAPAFCSIAK